MEQETTLSRSIDIVEQKAQYDEACKKVLAEKIILAWIMKHTIKEYAEYDVREIMERFIIGEPEVGKRKVLPDETNAPRITGTGVEDSTLTEGKVTYDIQFRAIIPDGNEVVQMIINVEAQNDFHPGYPIIKRGIYYCARMISSQYGTVFTKSHYEKIQKVYSVWICMNPPKERSNTITQYSISEKNLYGNMEEEKEYYDLMNAIMICLGKNETEHDLLRMLDVLLSSDKKAAEKKAILEDEFKIPMTEKMEEEVKHMCNLSDGVENKGIQKGIKIGIEQGIEQEHIRAIERKLEKNKSVEQIADELEMEIADVEKYIQTIGKKQ
ncbi:MAG: hypothetical protein IKJ16_04240 [Agathobacter sp.]|nr:hypothetical protein [Agathobacter sp.]